MPRYEFSEGSSNKFWQIDLKGASFTTTYGKIGAAGQTSLKTFSSDGDARKEYDKLVAEKVKKGYALVGGKAAKAAPAAKAKAAPAKAVSAPKKVAKPAAKVGNHPSATKNAKYFELSDGGSSKFWEIFLDGTSVKSRHGKIGAKGQLVLKEFGSKAEAQKEIDRLIAEKTKKGYQGPLDASGGGGGADDADDADTGGGAVAGGNARNPELEAGIVADPYDKNAWMVLADWLQDQGDPRGELIALQIGNKTKPAAAFLEKHKGYFLGPLGEHLKCYDGTKEDTFTWRNGFIFGVRLSHNQYAEDFKGKLNQVLTKLLDHPSGRFITEMAFQDNDDPNEDTLDDLIAILAKRAPKTIRKLEFGDRVDQISWYNVGNLGKLWKAVPNLRTLLIEAGSFTLGTIDLPELKRAVFETGGLSSSSGKSIATASWPNIEHLEIYYGDDNYGGDCSIKQVKPLLDRTDLVNLRYLGLKNSEFADDIAAALPTAKILKGLKTLDLSLGCMTSVGAQALAASADAFKHLDSIDVSENYIGDVGVAALKKAFGKKAAGLDDQRGDETEEYRHPSVSE